MNIHPDVRRQLHPDEEVFSKPIPKGGSITIITDALKAHGQPWRTVEYTEHFTQCYRRGKVYPIKRSYTVVVVHSSFYCSIWHQKVYVPKNI